MKRYPRSIKVGKARYSIVMMPFLGDESTVGYCEDSVKLIALYSGQSKRALFSSFLHELLHAIETEHQVKLKHKTVYALEKALAQVFEDNFTISPKRRSS